MRFIMATALALLIGGCTYNPYRSLLSKSTPEETAAFNKMHPEFAKKKAKRSARHVRSAKAKPAPAPVSEPAVQPAIEAGPVEAAPVPAVIVEKPVASPKPAPAAKPKPQRKLREHWWQFWRPSGT